MTRRLLAESRPAFRGQARITSAAGAPAIAASAAPVYSVPFLLTLAYLFVEYGRPQSWVPAVGLLRPGTFVLGGGMLALIVTRSFPSDRLVKHMVGFLGLMVLLIPVAFNHRRAFNESWNFALLLFGGMLPVVAFVDSSDRLKILMRFWVVIHVPLAIYSLTHKGVGVGSFLGDENDFALALNMALPYAYATLLVERGIVRRALALIATIVLVSAVAATMSRGGFVGLLCVGITVWLRSDRKVVSALAVATLALAFVLAAPQSYWKEVESISTANRKGDTGSQRLYYWSIGWQIFLDHPIIGVGPSNFGYNAPNYELEERKDEGEHVWGRAAHSLYFTLLPEMGLPGTVLFGVMLLHGFGRRRRLASSCRSALKTAGLSEPDRARAHWFLRFSSCMDASLVGFLSSGAFISVLYYPHVWLLTALTAAITGVGCRELAAMKARSADAAGPAGAGRAPVAWGRRGRLSPALTRA